MFCLPKVNYFFGIKPLLNVFLHIFDQISNIQNTGKAMKNKYLHFELLFLIGSFLELNLQNDVKLGRY